MIKISMIAALSENRIIGNKGKIPWHIKEDLEYFWKKTDSHVVIMGRKAFENMWEYYRKAQKQLPDRQYIIVTRNPKYISDSLKQGPTRSPIIVNSIETALEKAKETESEEIFIAGGEQIYKQSIKYADKLYLTIIKGNFQGDTYFPDYSEFKKVISQKSGHTEDIIYVFLILSR